MITGETLVVCFMAYGCTMGARQVRKTLVAGPRGGFVMAEERPGRLSGGQRLAVGVVVLDLVLSWTGQPIGWLRQLVRALTVGTVAANAAAGWPARDPIPAARWLLAPWSTWLMWRRMVLWQVGGFHAALEAEQEGRRVVVLLRARYGRRWRRYAPPDLAWKLRSSATASDVVASAGRVAALAESDIGHDVAGGESKTRGSDMSADGRRAANGHVGSGDAGHSPDPVRPRPSMARVVTHARRSAPARRDPLIEAGLLLADQPDMTGADLGRELGVSPRHGLRLKKQIGSGAAR